MESFQCAKAIIWIPRKAQAINHGLSQISSHEPTSCGPSIDNRTGETRLSNGQHAKGTCKSFAERGVFAEGRVLAVDAIAEVAIRDLTAHLAELASAQVRLKWQNRTAGTSQACANKWPFPAWTKMGRSGSPRHNGTWVRHSNPPAWKARTISS